MDLWTRVGALLLLVSFVVSAIWLRRQSDGPRPFTAAGWSCLLGAALVAGSAVEPPRFGFGEVLAGAFPMLLLAGELQRAGRPLPVRLLLGLGALLLLRGASSPVDPRVAPALAAAVDAPLLLATAWVAWRGVRPDASPVGRMAAVAIGLLAAPRLVDSWSDFFGGAPLSTVPLWTTLAFPTLALQLWAGLENARRDAKRARAALAASLRRFERIADGMLDLVAETDASGRFVYASPSYGSVLGWDPQALVGSNAPALVHPDDVGSVLRAAESAGGSDEWVHPRHRLRHRDGGWRWFEGTTRLYASEAGEPGAVVVNLDVTDRVRFEKRAHAAQRFESLRLLAGGIAREFNDLLVPAVTNVDLLRRLLPSDGDETELLAEIEAAAQRAAELVDQLRALSGEDGGAREGPVDLSPLTGEVAHLFLRTLPSHVSLHTKLSGGLPPVGGDPSRLRQGVAALLANAFEALGDEGGSIHVATGLVDLDPAGAAALDLNAPLAAGSYLYLDVRDDGHGVPPELRDRIFDPFVTTKPDGHGLGLPALMGTVRALGGAVEVHSAPGRGSLFRVLLPPAEADEEAVEPPPPQAAPGWRGRGRVLLVDEEETVRRATRRALESLGFAVEETRNSAEAIAAYQRASDAIVAVVLDAGMRQRSGEHAYEALCRMRLDPPVLLTSNFVEREEEERLTARPRVRLLPKPFTVDALGAAMRDLVET